MRRAASSPCHRGNLQDRHDSPFWRDRRNPASRRRIAGKSRQLGPAEMPRPERPLRLAKVSKVVTPFQSKLTFGRLRTDDRVASNPAVWTEAAGGTCHQARLCGRRHYARRPVCSAPLVLPQLIGRPPRQPVEAATASGPSDRLPKLRTFTGLRVAPRPMNRVRGTGQRELSQHTPYEPRPSVREFPAAPAAGNEGAQPTATFASNRGQRVRAPCSDRCSNSSESILESLQ